jgi:hypothetical protein
MSLAMTIAVPLLVVAGCGSTSSSPATKPPATNAPHRSSGVADSRCSESRLTAHVVSGGSEASQPWLIIDVINHGPRCTIDGYPRIVAAIGHSWNGRNQSLSIRVRDGSDYEHGDPGPRALELLRGGSASFAAGTDTASGTNYLVTSLTVALPGSPGTLRVPVHTGASSSAGKPVYIGVTALVNGSKGPPAY